MTKHGAFSHNPESHGVCQALIALHIGRGRSSHYGYPQAAKPHGLGSRSPLSEAAKSFESGCSLQQHVSHVDIPIYLESLSDEQIAYRLNTPLPPCKNKIKPPNIKMYEYIHSHF
jgi:hypothetical protein